MKTNYFFRVLAKRAKKVKTDTFRNYLQNSVTFLKQFSQEESKNPKTIHRKFKQRAQSVFNILWFKFCKKFLKNASSVLVGIYGNFWSSLLLLMHRINSSLKSKDVSAFWQWISNYLVPFRLLKKVYNNKKYKLEKRQNQIESLIFGLQLQK